MKLGLSCTEAYNDAAVDRQLVRSFLPCTAPGPRPSWPRDSLHSILLGGVYEDDRLNLTIAAREYAEAHVSTQSATVVHTMPLGSAEQRIKIRCESGSYLEYLPDTQILFPGSRHWSSTNIQRGDGAIAMVSDSFLRHDPDGFSGVEDPDYATRSARPSPYEPWSDANALRDFSERHTL